MGAADRRRTALILAGTGAAALSVAAVLLVSFVSMRKRSDEERCRGNLVILSLALRSGELFDSPRWDEAGAGRAFLAQPQKWPVRVSRALEYSCPVKGTRDDLDYRGPARPLRQLGWDEPIAADRPGNHGPGKGGNVLLKSGAVHTVPEDHPLWAKAAATTSD